MIIRYNLVMVQHECLERVAPTKSHGQNVYEATETHTNTPCYTALSTVTSPEVMVGGPTTNAARNCLMISISLIPYLGLAVRLNYPAAGTTPGSCLPFSWPPTPLQRTA